jgi:hypothetical protein
MNETNEKKNSLKFGLLMGCLFLAVLLCVAQIVGSSLLILAVFVLLCVVIIWTSCREGALSVLLFFLPWSPLMKFYRGGVSFFTIAIISACLVFFAKDHYRIGVYQWVVTSIIVVVTLISKMMNGFSVAMYYLRFILMLLLFPSIIRCSGKDLSLFEMTMFFSLGIISAALLAKYVSGYANISQYIKVDSYLMITRLSGFYGDPNFYSAHITASLSGVQLLILMETDLRKRAALFIILLTLIYCGMLSASKSFGVVTIMLFLFWIPLILERRNRGGKALRLIVALVGGALVALSLSAFKELLRVLDARFAAAVTISDLTTKRTDLWRRYALELIKDLRMLFIGVGYTTVTIGGKSTHNTLIQGIYQLGLIGFIPLVFWQLFVLDDFAEERSLAKADWRCVLLMCIGVLLPWVSIDMLFFDELFLLPVFAVLGIIEYSNYSETDLV